MRDDIKGMVSGGRCDRAQHCIANSIDELGKCEIRLEKFKLSSPQWTRVKMRYGQLQPLIKEI